MQDLTEGSVGQHIVKLSVPIAIGMVFQTLYYLVDLYFIGQLGDTAVAGLTTAGNLQFLVMAVTQILGVGTMALIAQASGRKDRDDANLIFNNEIFANTELGIDLRHRSGDWSLFDACVPRVFRSVCCWPRLLPC